MKKTFLMILLVSINLLVAQDKIKGNKLIGFKKSELENFDKIDISSDLEVTIIKDYFNGFEITGDSNLLEVIHLDVENGKLLIWADKRIVSYKKLQVSIYFKDISELTVNGKSSVFGEKIDLSRLNLILNDKSECELKASINDLEIKSSKGTKLSLNGNLDTVRLDAKDNSSIYLNGNFKELIINAHNRTDIKLKGRSKNIEFRGTNSAELNAKKMNSNQATIDLRDRSSVTLSIKSELTLSIEDKSEVLLYGSPNIQVKKMSGSAKIIKK